MKAQGPQTIVDFVVTEDLVDSIVALQIKVAAIERVLLLNDQLLDQYNRIVDELGVAYIKEREARKKRNSKELLGRPN